MEIGTVTTTEADLEYEKFKVVERTGEAGMTNYNFRWKYEQTVHTIDPTITVEPITRTVPSYHQDQPYHPFRAQIEVGVGDRGEEGEGGDQVP